MRDARAETFCRRNHVANNSSRKTGIKEISGILKGKEGRASIQIS